GSTVSFQGDVSIATGAQFDVEPGSPTVVINTLLRNQGAMRWISDCNRFDLQGSDHLENEGTWEIFMDPACQNGTEGIVRVPVNVPVGGKLLLSANAQVDFFSGSSLNVDGQLEIQTGARLRFDGSNPPRDINLTAASVLSGDGTVRLE